MSEEEGWRELFGADVGRDRAPDEAVALARLRREMFTTQTDPVRLGRLTITERLGKGGMGVVYAAYDPELDRRVAVKVLHVQSERAAERALREGRSLARISHPNVVVVHGVENAGGQLNIVMEYVGGGTLRKWLSSEKRPWKEIVERFLEAGRGLEAAHLEGLVHGDFKPDNVLLGIEGERARVADFGLATAQADPTSSDAPADGGDTQSAFGRGTAGYAPPEQASGGTCDARADQFSYCVSLYEALYGIRPFSAAELCATNLPIPVSPTVTRPAIPSSIARAVTRGLRGDPRERFSSMRPLLDQLDKAMHPRWPRYGAVFAGGGGLIAGLLLALHATTTDCEEEPRAMTAQWESGQAGLRAALDRTRGADAVDIGARVDARANVYVEQWSAAWRQNCDAGSSTEFVLRRRCLSDERQRFEALIAAATELTDEEVPHLMTAVADLAKPGRCAGAAAAGGLPPSAHHEAEVARLRAILARAEAESELARYSQAQRSAQEVVNAATTIGAQSLVADALHAIASVHENLGTTARAEESHETALWQAYRAGNHRVVALSAIRLVYLRGYVASDANEGDWWLAMAEQATEVADPAGPIAAAAERARAMLALRRGSTTDAKRHLRSAIQIYETTLGPEHYAVASATQNLAVVTGMSGDYATAIELLDRSGALFDAALGPTHPETASALKAKGEFLRREDRLDEAVAVLEQAIDRLQASQGGQQMLGDAYGVLGHVLKDKGELEASEQVTRQALKTLGSVTGEDTVTIAIEHNNLALILRELNHLEDAESHFRTSISIKEKLLGRADFQLAPTLLNLGGILIEQGEREKALVVVDRGMEILDQAEIEPIEVFRGRIDGAGHLRQLGQPRRAETILLAAIVTAQGNPSAKRHLGGAYRVLAAARADLGDVAGAREAIITARRLLPEDAEREHSKLRDLEAALP